MEIRRVTSDYEFTLNNVMKEILLFYFFCLMGFYLFRYSKYYYRIGTKFAKNFFTISFISELFFLLITFIYCSLIFYLFHLVSFGSVRDFVFYIWRNLFETDSNLKDFYSFKMFYCEDNIEIENLNEIDQVFVDSTNLLCAGSFLLDSGYIENIILVIILGWEIISNFLFLFKNQIQDRNENNEDEADNSFLENLLKFYLIILFLYFVYLYFSTYSYYSQIKILKNEYLHTDIIINYENYSENINLENIENINLEEVEVEQLNENSSPIIIILKFIFEILFEILA